MLPLQSDLFGKPKSHLRDFEFLTLVTDYRACRQLGSAGNALPPSLLVAFLFYFLTSKSRIAYHSFLPDTYYLAFPHDRLQAKLQVYAVLIFELFQSAVVAHDVVVTLVVGGLGDFSAASELSSDLYFSLDSLHTHWFSIPLAGGISECNLLSYKGLLINKMI